MNGPTERAPVGLGWTRLEDVYLQSAGDGRRRRVGSRWWDGELLVTSSLDDAELPGGNGATGPQWHISVSRRVEGPTGASLGLGRVRDQGEITRVLCAFQMIGAEEDNHEPGRARHFWMPVDPRFRVDCECKADERTIVEPDGHTWTTPVDGPCNGCAAAMVAIGIRCPLHAEALP